MRPLAGKRIAVTRAREQAGELCSLLEERGATALRCPSIRLAPPESYVPLDAALSRLDQFDWLIFTSANGVQAALERLPRLSMRPPDLAVVRIGAVGERTAAALSEAGLAVAFVPEDERAASLAASLAPLRGMRVLLLRADVADPGPGETLQRRGAAHVEDVVAYRTEPTELGPEAIEELRLGVDGITFTSPSTVEGFLRSGAEARAIAASAVVASIGPVTSAAARGLGLTVGVEAGERSMRALVQALVTWFVEERVGETEGRSRNA